MGRLDVTGRPLALRALDLDTFFRPQTIAVVGASDSPGSASALNYRMLCGWVEGRDIEIVPVNPRRGDIGGRTCYPSLLDVPGDVDVAVILTSNVSEPLREAIERKVPFAMIFTAGFAESGADGAARQREIEALLETGETRVLGPNTTLNAWQPFRDDLPGRGIALITHSGHQGRPLYQAQDIGVRISHWAPTGNELDLEAADFISYFADQPEVGAIACYIEGFKDGRTLQLALDHAARRGTPVVVIKVGRTELGRSWTQSHSAHLAGSDAVIRAVFRQYGVIRVDGLDELLETSTLLARAPAPSGDGVCVYSISGGTGAHTADLATSLGLRLPGLSRETQDRLHEWIAPFLRVSNPVDSGGHPTADERGRWILDAILADPAVDVLVVPIAGEVPGITDRLAQDLADVAATTTKPVCVVWGSPVGAEPSYRDVLLPSGLPVFRSVPGCLRAVKAYLDHHAFVRDYKSGFDKVPTRALKKAPLAAEAARTLSERESKSLIAAYGVGVTRDELCSSAAEAVRAAERIGYPVVLKACSADLAHKTELGLVRVGLGSAREVRGAYAEIVDNAPPLDGVLVCEMVTGGVECVLGISRDELFGPVVVFGLGGVAVEVYRDVTFRVPPFTKREARRMIEEVRALPLLRGSRGAPKANLNALADAIMKVQRLAMDLHDSLEELDINPLLARPDGVVALDALAVLR